jgi:hypothetical protein
MVDFPAPTGVMTTVSFPERMDCIAASWNGNGAWQNALSEVAESLFSSG